MGGEEEQTLEINLISAQDIPFSSAASTYATISTSTITKPLRTRKSTSATWNDKFLFRLTSSFFLSSSFIIKIYSHRSAFLPDSLLGSVRLLVNNYHLLEASKDVPTFTAVGIRRPSGRFQGVLNVGFMLLSKVSKVIDEELRIFPAVGYRDLMGEGLKRSGSSGNLVNMVLKEVNLNRIGSGSSSNGGSKWNADDGGDENEDKCSSSSRS